MRKVTSTFETYLFKVDIHYIKLYHIQVDITKNRETQKRLNTKLVQNKEPFFNSISSFPLSLAFINLLSFCHCWIYAVRSDQ